MPVTALDGVIQSYQAGREQQMKQAKEIASQEADRWERQFRTQQAGEAAKRSVADLAIRQQQADTEKQYASIRKAELDRREKLDKSKDDLANKALDLKTKLNDKKLTLQEQMNLRKEFFSTFDKLMLGHTGQEALEIAQFAHNAFPDLMQPSPNNEPQPPVQAQPAPQGMNPNDPAGLNQAAIGLMNGQGEKPPIGANLLSHVRPSSDGMPDSAMHLSPIQDAQVKSKLAQIADANSKIKARDDAEKYKQAYTVARTQLTAANAKSVEDARQRNNRAEPFKIELMKAEIVHVQTTTKTALENANIAEHREKRMSIETDLKNAATAGKAKDALRKQVATTRHAALLLNEEIMRNVKGMENADFQLQKPEVVKSKAMQNTINGMKAAFAAQLTDLNAKYADANVEYLETKALADQNKVSVVTTPSGGDAQKKQDAHSRAVEKELADAKKKLKSMQRLAPAPVAPPGTHAAPGTLGTRPLRKKGNVVFSEGGITIREH